MTTLRSIVRCLAGLAAICAVGAMTISTAYAVTLPVVDGSLKLWLDAGAIAGASDGDPIGQWSDLSGNAHHASQTDPARQPVYVADAAGGRPALFFDGADDGMVTGLDLGTNVTPYTVFAVFNTRSSVGALRRAVQGSQNWLVGPYVNELRHYTPSGGWAANPGPPASAGQFFLTEAHNTGAATTFLVDATDVTTNPASIGSPGVVHLAGSGNYPNEVLDGDIAEVIVYDRALSGTEQRAVSAYLKQKYGLVNVFNLAYQRPIIDGSSAYNNVGFNQGAFPASRVTDGRRDDTHSGSYWLGSDGDATEYFTLDLGSSQPVQSIALRNTHNDQYNDRGTRTFQLWASNGVDGSNRLVDPALILEGTLTTSHGPAGDTMIPLDYFNEYNGLAPGNYRYLRFDTLAPAFNGNHVGLNEILVYSESLSANVAAGKPVTASGFLPGYPDFVPQNVVDQRIDDFRAGTAYFDHARNGSLASYWLGRIGQEDEWIVIDLGAPMTIDRVDLQNTHNTTYDDFGTQDFRIEASVDGQSFTTVFSGTLADARGTGDQIPIESFSVADGDFAAFNARYVRFWAESYYGNGAGLNEIFVFASVPEPSTWLLLSLGGLGLLAAGGGARRRRGSMDTAGAPR